MVQPPLSFDDCLIDFSLLKPGKELGRGNFGVVYEGHMKAVKVAIKESLHARDHEDFRQEASVMHKICHPLLVRFLGYCCNAPHGRPLIITEFMAKGNLKDYLRTSEGRELSYIDLIKMLDQVIY